VSLSKWCPTKQKRLAHLCTDLLFASLRRQYIRGRR